LIISLIAIVPNYIIESLLEVLTIKSLAMSQTLQPAEL